MTSVPQPPVDSPEAWQAVFDRSFHHFWHEELGGDRLERDLERIRLACGLTPRTRVLDLGCGYGRIANRLAAEGVPVTGVDQSAELLGLARAATADPAPTYVEGDMREAQADEAFDIALLWGTTFGYFTDRENLSVLQGAYRSLRPGGSLVIETRNWDRIDRDFSTWTVRRNGSDLLIERHEFIPTTGRQKTDQILLVEDERRCRSYSLRRYTAAELAAALRSVGFESVTVSGEDMSPLTVDHKRMIVVAARGGAE